METKVLLNSTMADLLAYGRERIATRRIALLVAFIAGLVFFAEYPQGAMDVAVRLLLVMALIVQFRVWDDLEDRDYDQKHHPERVLSRIESNLSFLVLLGGLSVLVIGLLSTDGNSAARVGRYLMLLLLIGLVYRCVRWGALQRRFLRSQLVLLKYPVFVLLLLESPWSHWAVFVAATGYLALSVYEWHDDSERQVAPIRFSPPWPEMFEPVPCYACGSQDSIPLTKAQEDLTGKPGSFSFVTCRSCDLSYQDPRLKLEYIGAYYDDEYIAHRKKTEWGPLTPFYERAMDKHDREKVALVSRYMALHRNSSVLDVGCGAGTYLAKVRKMFGCRVVAVDFKELSGLPSFRKIEFHCGLFYEQKFSDQSFDLITMWHFLEHDYDPLRTLRFARELLVPEGRLVIEVPRLDSLTWRLYRGRWPGLQAPQHTVLFSRESLQSMVRQAGLEMVDYLPYGAFPPYFYIFTGAAFKLLKGRGLNLGRAIFPYFLGQVLLFPVLLFQRKLNLAMQTVVCRRPEKPSP
jgi:SAM-dependent methyltransferase